ncbi:class I SAM-dependent methyltransferase [Arhodomonas aquaeolei]|uniref:class I SAM-dependent methyltransferase n=1 Tax=Arhodomonas aquaeolei TaxID=2369 RepID=UPI00036D48A3|nr:methyltransferase domain-containing protein [Arhodomonas aquaeolei]
MPINTNRWNRWRYTVYTPIYDAVAGGFARQRRRAVALAGLVPGERVLLSGAGSGLDLTAIPTDNPVTAVDITPAMIARLRRRARRAGRQVDARVMDAAALTFPPASFDVVFLHLILAVIPDPVGCIREAARVLRPGGRVVIFDKFLADDARPGLVRRALDPLATVLATGLNRRVGPLLNAAGLERVHDEPAGLGGLFRIVVARPAQAVSGPA